MARIAFLSTAHIHTKGFIDVINKTDGLSTTVVWDDVADRGRRYAESASGRFIADLDAAVRADDIDGFIICAENTRHLPLLQKTLPLGKPVFCEKPLCVSTADLAAVRALIAKHPGTPVSCGYFQPFSDVAQGIKALIDAGAFGRITRVRYRNAHNAAYGRWFDNPDLNWFYQTELSGGGAFMDMGSHAIHFLRRFFGPVDQVFAIIRNESNEYPCDDFGIAHLRFASGVLGSIEAGWTQTGGISGLEIVGSKATLYNTADGYRLVSPGQQPQPITPGPALPTRVERLVAIIRGELPPSEVAADLPCILDTVAINAACYAASAAGVWSPVG